MRTFWRFLSTVFLVVGAGAFWFALTAESEIPTSFVFAAGVSGIISLGIGYVIWLLSGAEEVP